VWQLQLAPGVQTGHRIGSKVGRHQVEHPPRGNRHRGARIPPTMEIIMSAPQATASPVSLIPEIKFSDMTLPGKAIHVLKMFIFFLSAGFIYPNILMTD
jgi:hypothetical protein